MNPNRTASNGAPVTVTLLGTGDAFASFGRSQSGYLIDAPGGRILMEAGPGLLPALKSNGIAPDSFDLLNSFHGYQPMGGVSARPSSAARIFGAGLCAHVTGVRNENTMAIPIICKGVFFNEVVLGWKLY